MAEVLTRPTALATSTQPPPATQAISIPPTSIALPPANPARFQNQPPLDTYSSPVNQNGCFEFDRVIKSGYVQKRTQKTKTWKTIYLVLRPNTLYIYKSDKEEKLRHKIYLSDLTAVTFLKDPKQKRKNVFGLFSPSKNFHFQGNTAKDSQEWVELIRKDARIEEEEEEMFLASPVIRRQSFGMGGFFPSATESSRVLAERDRLASSSPEPLDPPSVVFSVSARRASQIAESSGVSGNEFASHSDLSDTEGQRVHGASIESLAIQSPPVPQPERPALGFRNSSQISGLNIEQDPDRVVWQGWLWFLKSKGGVKQWKNSWAVLRPRNLILYKDESEYSAQFIVHMSSILNVVDIDPISRTKKYCLQIITEEKSYRFSAHDEESSLQCLGAFKSLLSKRRELEARAAAAATT